MTPTAASMIRGALDNRPQDDRVAARESIVSPGVVWGDWNIQREEWETRNGHKAAALWFTGISGAGKSTIARGVERQLFAAGRRTMLLDGDQLRHGLCGDLGFSPEDRKENIRRVGEVARLFFEHGAVVLCAFVSPYREDRRRVRDLFPNGRFIEVHVHCDVETARQRDPKGLYARAAAGEIKQMTGVSAPYEAPDDPELTLDTRTGPAELHIAAVLGRLSTLLDADQEATRS